MKKCSDNGQRCVLCLLRLRRVRCGRRPVEEEEVTHCYFLLFDWFLGEKRANYNSRLRHR